MVFSFSAVVTAAAAEKQRNKTKSTKLIIAKSNGAYWDRAALYADPNWFFQFFWVWKIRQ